MTVTLDKMELTGGAKASRYVVPVGSKTVLHNHSEDEVMIVLGGTGKIIVGKEEKFLQKGSIIEVPSLSDHIVINTGLIELDICNLWWYEKSGKSALDEAETETYTDIFLPSYITPNGKMHLGHLAGPILVSDILHRAQKMQGMFSKLVAGTIGYQTNVAVSAIEGNLSYKETALEFSRQILSTLDLASIDYDVFVTLEDEELFQVIGRDFCKILIEEGHAEFKFKETPYCENCKKYLFEAHVSCSCPHCRNKNVIGECESCGIYIPDDRLIDPVCSYCSMPCSSRPLGRYFVDLNKHKEFFCELYASFPFPIKRLLRSVRENILPEIPLSIIADDGIELAKSSNHSPEKHVVYSAVELVPRFLIGLKKTCLDSNSIRVNLLFGKDNLYLRAVIFPILLSLVRPDIKLNSLLMNHFYKLGGNKFSTNRKNVVYLDELLKNGRHTVDEIRLYLSYTYPQHTEESFVESDIILVKNEVKFIFETIEAIFTECLPRIFGTEPGSWTASQKKVLLQTEELIILTKLSYSPKRLQLRIPFEMLSQQLRSSQMRFLSTEFDAQRDDRTNNFLMLYVAYTSIAVLYPIMPKLCSSIQEKYSIQRIEFYFFKEWMRNLNVLLCYD